MLKKNSRSKSGVHSDESTFNWHDFLLRTKMFPPLLEVVNTLCRAGRANQTEVCSQFPPNVRVEDFASASANCSLLLSNLLIVMVEKQTLEESVDSGML